MNHVAHLRHAPQPLVHQTADPIGLFRLEMQVGQVVQIVSKNGVITIVPDQPIGRMRGFLKGMKTTAYREKKDRE